MQDSRTPLHWAASAGHIDVATYLLANGAEVDKVDDSGWTALHISGEWDLTPNCFLIHLRFSSQRWS
jgi:hypothetical protein